MPAISPEICPRFAVAGGNLSATHAGSFTRLQKTSMLSDRKKKTACGKPHPGPHPSAATLPAHAAAERNIKNAAGGDLRRGEIAEHMGHGAFTARIWAGAAGLGGIYNPVGIGTILEEGKEKRLLDGKEYLLQLPLKADFSLIAAYKADKVGNLIYRGTGRQYCPLMAKAANVTIVEVDEIVESGKLDPESIITPGIYVHRILKIPEEDQG